MIPLPPKDPALGSIEIALDSAAMCELLQATLPECISGELRMLSCQPRAVGYKPGRYCMVEYRLTLQEVTSSRTIETHAHVRLDHGRRAEKRWKNGVLHRLVTDATRFHQSAPHGRAAFLPDLRALVQVYPVDLKLPELVRATSPAFMLERLREALPERVRGDCATCDIKLVRYRPGSRAVLRYALGSEHPVVVYGKIQHGEQSVRLMRLADTLQAAGIATPTPLAYLDDLKMSLHAEARGIPLRSMHKTAAFDAWMVPLANTLVRMHQVSAPELPGPSPERMAAETVHAAEKIAAILPPLAADLQRLVHELTHELACVATDSANWSATVHGDFYEDQIFVPTQMPGGVDAQDVVILDLEEAEIGHPLIDVGHFLAQLSLHPTPGDARAAFLDAYTRLRPAARTHVLLFEAAWLLRLAAGPFQRLRPNWPRKVTRRVRYAAQRLEEYQSGDKSA